MNREGGSPRHNLLSKRHSVEGFFPLFGQTSHNILVTGSMRSLENEREMGSLAPCPAMRTGVGSLA